MSFEGKWQRKVEPSPGAESGAKEVSIPELARIVAQFAEKSNAIVGEPASEMESEREVLDFSVPKPLDGFGSDSLREEIQRIEQERREKEQGGDTK